MVSGRRAAGRAGYMYVMCEYVQTWWTATPLPAYKYTHPWAPSGQSVLEAPGDSLLLAPCSLLLPASAHRVCSCRRPLLAPAVGARQHKVGSCSPRRCMPACLPACLPFLHHCNHCHCLDAIDCTAHLALPSHRLVSSHPKRQHVDMYRPGRWPPMLMVARGTVQAGRVLG